MSSEVITETCGNDVGDGLDAWVSGTVPEVLVQGCVMCRHMHPTVRTCHSYGIVTD